jgi:hypothetical protein
VLGRSGEKGWWPARCGGERHGADAVAVQHAVVAVRRGSAIAVESGGDSRMGAVAVTILEKSERRFFFQECCGVTRATV